MNNLDLIYNIKAKIVARVGNGISGRIYFEALSPQELNKNIIAELQTNLGYHPGGYDGPWITRSYLGDNGWKYEWSCSTSCD